MEERSAQFGNVADRRQWRLVTLMHLAETRRQAVRDVEFSLADYARDFREVAALPIFPDAPSRRSSTPQELRRRRHRHPDDAIELIQHLIDGVPRRVRHAAAAEHEWANPEATRRSYELFAQYVLPHFDPTSRRPPRRWGG